ncbi:hypothetical protein M2160_008640 [Streptomyces sp. SAI-117]|uniref:hypothetical protein n=1 Tax=unclassified Streptomyces TaxID=2593676 RepID=UPI002475E44C|nr:MULTISPECIES: hypothetical protein [unclassified Streptomyces]MDH6573533.1 hypothetical protein [Streptomyces sp. SAI-117]MDH6581730.1 hypothetical protein [Streptomyces sp. SAI-133]
MTPLGFALIAGIAAYAVSHSLATALSSGGSTFLSVAFGLPQLVNMWFHGS